MAKSEILSRVKLIPFLVFMVAQTMLDFHSGKFNKKKVVFYSNLIQINFFNKIKIKMDYQIENIFICIG